MSLSVSHRNNEFLDENRVFEVKTTIFLRWSQKQTIWQNYQKYHRKSFKIFFLGFWDRLFAIGWIKEQFLKKMFLPKICSFWTKNAIFCWKFFWPHPFFGRKQTKWPKKSAEYQKYPKSWPKKFLWPSDQNSRKNLKKQTPPLLESPPGGRVNWQVI